MEDPNRNDPADSRDPYVEPRRDKTMPPTAANQTVERSSGASTFVAVAIAAAILVVLFFAFGGGNFFGGAETAMEGEDTIAIPDDTTTATPGTDAPTETAPAAPDDGATDAAPAAPQDGGDAAPAPETEAPAAQ